MNKHYTYFLILAISLIIPLLLSFDKKVAFYKNTKYVFSAMQLPALFYILWDILFTAKGVWHFNENYITGFKFINLPAEEILFFFIVPYCCVFMYQCVKVYCTTYKNKAVADVILILIGLILWLTGIFFYNKIYTSVTFIFTAIFIACIYFFKKYFKAFDAVLFLISYIIILIPFLIVDGFLTAIPVVIYNDTENLGIRIYTIPIEDIFYGMLLIMANIVIYEKLKNN